MKKAYKMTDLCCANCATEIERNVAKIDGVNSCTVNFIAQKMLLDVSDTADFDAVMKKVLHEVKRVEPDCDLV